METLFFLAIAVIIAIFENRVKKSREQKQLPPANLDDYDSEHAEDSQEEAQEPQAQPPRSLQDLIQQFENAQREAAQGNIEPPTYLLRVVMRSYISSKASVVSKPALAAVV